jgi:prolyl oligopeptidase
MRDTWSGVKPVRTLALWALWAMACGPTERAPIAAAAYHPAPVVAPPASSTPSAGTAHRRYQYPAPPKSDVVDDYHGTRIADPYRGFEDLDSAATRGFVEAENRVTRAFLDGIPARAALARRLEELWDYERYSVPTRSGNALFFSKNDGLQNQPVFYAQALPKGAPEVLIDPNTLSSDGTTSLGFTSPSRDGRRVAYGVVAAGSDWTTIHVLDVRTKKDLADELRWVKFSEAVWTNDGKGFFYDRFPEPPADAERSAPNYDQKIYFHALGTKQSADVLVFEKPGEKQWTYDNALTDDGRFLVVHVARSTDEPRRIMVADLTRTKPGKAPVFTDLVANFDAAYSFVGSRGTSLYFKTNLGAPRSRVVALNLSRPEAERLTPIIPEGDDALVGVRWVDDRLIATYLKDAHSEVVVFDTLGNRLQTVLLPGVGSTRGFTGRQGDHGTYYAFTGFASPPVIYEYSPTADVSRVFRAPKLQFDPAAFETTQVFATSRDGTRIPVFVTHKRGLKPDESTPAYLYGYGGFNISITPWFDVMPLVWMERGGLYAVATLRGGGEYGRSWHEAGMRGKKENVFDDFIAAASFLVERHMTSPARLAISGRSNGGLLVGACMTKRPDLFGVALPAVGVLDMLRYHEFTIGWAWADEYGTSDDDAGFRNLLGYSPLHNIKAGARYPATFITTADHDDRVVPAHSFKFAAALQAAQAGDAPVLLRVETNVGHGAGVPTKKKIEEEADRMAFIERAMGLRDP